MCAAVAVDRVRIEIIPVLGRWTLSRVAVAVGDGVGTTKASIQLK